MKRSRIALTICSSVLLLPAGSCLRKESDTESDNKATSKASKKSGCGMCHHEHRGCCGK